MSAGRARDESVPASAPLGIAGLCAFLDDTAERHPARIALTDQSDRLAWSGRPPITWTYGVAREIVGRLAAGLRALALPARSPVGLCLAGGAEHALALLAVEEAGLLPCLLPVSWDEDRLAAAIESARIAMVLTQGRVGDAAPAQTLCRVAARQFGLRFLGAFGPGVPDGVIPLDAIVVEARSAGRLGFAAPAGLVTFAGGPDRPIYRSADSLVAAVAAHLVSVHVQPGDRVVTLLPPEDLRGVVTGIGAALLAAAGVECHGVFSGSALATALTRAERTHLVVPGWMEPALAGAALPATIVSTTLVHRAPTSLGGRGALGGLVHDALAIDEDAVVTRSRGGADLASALDGDGAGAASTGLLRLDQSDDGRLLVGGPACAAAPFRRAAAKEAAPESLRSTRFRVDSFAGIAVGLSEA